MLDLLSGISVINRIYAGIAAVLSIILFVYFYHFRVIDNLKEDVKDKQELLDKTHSAVIKENAKVAPFEELWKTIKIHDGLENTKPPVKTPDDIVDKDNSKGGVDEVDDSLGVHIITI